MIRLMAVKDVPKIMKIERSSFSDPWYPSSFIDDIYNQIGYGIVYEDNDTVLGYGCMWLMYDEAHITNIAVKESERRKGIGKSLLKALIDKAKSLDYERALLEVRTSNTGAIKLYESFGFKIIHTMKKYYINNDEDGYLMELRF